MRAIVTVVGKDKVGIIAMTSAACAEHGANILDISQTVMKEYFTMIMLVDIDGLRGNFTSFADELHRKGAESGLDIRVMHEDIFKAMHTI